MNLLILNGDLPIFPGRAGHEYLLTTGMARRAQRVGLVSLVHTAEQEQGVRGLQEAGIDLYLWRSPEREAAANPPGGGRGFLRRASEAFDGTWRTWSRKPFDTFVQDRHFRRMAQPLLDALGDGAWQALIVVQSTSARWLDYVPRFPLSVLVLHDIRALVYERRAAAAQTARERRAWARQAGRYRHFEREYCRRYDLVITVSTADEAWVREHYRPARLVTIPIPIDAAYFSPIPSSRERPACIVFTGLMSHPPNADAACFFARDVLPAIRGRVPEAEFRIVGRDPTPEVAALAALPGVAVTGFVEDVRPFIAEAAVVVAPIRFGSGMRNKILEAWAMDKCVVSTRLGAEGLDCSDGVDILLADDVPALASRVIQALTDPEMRERLRGRGRKLVMSGHDPGDLAQKYHDALRAALPPPPADEEPLRAVIDLRWMRPGRAGGIENLSRSFVDELLRANHRDHFTVLSPGAVSRAFASRAGSNVVFVAAGGGLRDLARRAGLAGARFLHGRANARYWRTPEVESLRRARALGAEVALSIPGFIHPDLAALTNVLIVPDIQHEYFPEFFSPRDLAERRRAYTESARRAARLCAISEFTRRSLVDRLGVPEERIATAYLAADPIFHPASPARAKTAATLSAYGLTPGAYLLFPGNTWPHKNHQLAIAALGVLREAHGLDPLLVCTGSPREAHGDLLAKIEEAHLSPRVRFLGYCPQADMPGLYEGAAALVFPSLFEGFGMPLLEAMWCDCPVVCSNTTSLPEIAGDAAVLVDPRSPEELAHALSRVLTDSGLRRNLVERGRRRAREFSWAAFAAVIVRALHDARRLRYRA